MERTGIRMTTRRKKLTEEIKAGIRAAAAGLFTEKGYPSVTMREIAKAAGCSHTAIYLYFKNKEDLLQQIAIPPLEELEKRILSHRGKTDAPIDKLIAICREYAIFSLTHANIHKVLITSGSVRVDEQEPELEINRIRNRLFAHFMRALQEVVDERLGGKVSENALLDPTRVLFYYVQGYVGTYTDHIEPADSLLERTLPVLDEGVRIIVSGIERQISK
jgi:AcrR family transcriptional regulator